MNNKLIYAIAFSIIVCAGYYKFNVVEYEGQPTTGAVLDGDDIVYQFGKLFPNAALVLPRKDGNGFQIYDMSDVKMYVVDFGAGDCTQVVMRGAEVTLDSLCIENLTAVSKADD